MTERVAFQVKVYSGYTDSKEDIRLCNKVYKKLLLADVPIDPEPVRVAVNFANEITVVFDVPEQSTPMQVQRRYAQYWNDHIEPIFTGISYYEMKIEVLNQ